MRAVRVPDGLWRAFQRITAEQGESPSQVLRDAIIDYVREHDPETWRELHGE